MARAHNTAPNKHALHPFDLKYGTDTGGYLSPAELSGHRSNDALNNGYSAIAPSVFREALRRWRETLSASADHLEAYSFVDLGAGKGRALLLAAEFPFRKVIGVEINENLARIAEQNVARWSHGTNSRARIHVISRDAVEFQWPRNPLLVFLYNPFEHALVEQVAIKLATAAHSGAGLADLIYVNPTCADTLSRLGMFKLLWSAQVQMDEPDHLADPYGTASDRVSVYRYDPKARVEPKRPR